MPVGTVSLACLAVLIPGQGAAQVCGQGGDPGCESDGVGGLAARRRLLKIAATWPWADAITTAWQCPSAPPQAP